MGRRKVCRRKLWLHDLVIGVMLYRRIRYLFTLLVLVLRGRGNCIVVSNRGELREALKFGDICAMNG
jgi:hypothetical protein